MMEPCRKLSHTGRHAALLALALVTASVTALNVLGPLGVPGGPSTEITAAQDGALVYIEPAEVDAFVGEPFEIAVAIDDAIDLGAYQFTINFDEVAISFIESEVGDFPGSTGRNVVPVDPLTDTGSVTISAYSEPGAPGPSGSGELAKVRFMALTEAETDLFLVEVVLADTANNDLPIAEVRDALVYITPPTAPTPEAPEVYLPVLLRDRP